MSEWFGKQGKGYAEETDYWGSPRRSEKWFLGYLILDAIDADRIKKLREAKWRFGDPWREIYSWEYNEEV